MDIPRKIGIGIVMLVPTFVGSGAIWDIFGSYIPVAIWIIIMIALAGSIITGKLSNA